MSAKHFLDTNILVYAYDSHEPQKQTIAQSLLRKGIREESAVLSVQVLSEFFNAVTRRIPSPLSSDQGLETIRRFRIIPTVDLDVDLVERAINTHKQYQISYWDGLIIAAAERANCTKILSEDLNEGQTYNDIPVANPFRDTT